MRWTATSDEQRYLSTREAAEYLGRSARTLRQYRVSGAGPVYHRFGRAVRYAREDLERWAKARRRGPAAASGKALGEDAT